MRRTVETDAAPKPVGPYAQAVLAGDFVFVAGQIGLDPATGKLVHGRHACRARARARQPRGGAARRRVIGLDDVVKTTVYLVDLARRWRLVNEVYAAAFPAPHPARATVQVAALPAGARVEIEAIAVRSGREPIG